MMINEFLFISLYVIIGISTWMFLWVSIMNFIEANISTNNESFTSRIKFKRKI